MKNIFIAIIIACLVFTACEEDSYTLKVYDPIGGFVDREIDAVAEYDAINFEDVSFIFDMQRMDNVESVDLTIAVESVEPENLASAISLITDKITVVGQDSSTVDLVKVDWSKIDTAQTVQVILGVQDEEGVNTETVLRTTSFIAAKDPAPLASLDESGVYNAQIPYGSTENTIFKYTIELLDKPTNQDVVIPFTAAPADGVIEGIHFTFKEKVLRVAKGSRSAVLEVETLFAGFDLGDAESLWIELHQEDIPEGTLIKVNSDSYWTKIELGREWKNVAFLDKTATVSILIASTLEGEVTQSVEIENVLEKPAHADVNIPVVFQDSWTDAEEGVHFKVADAFIKVKEGETSGIVNLIIIRDAFDEDNSTIDMYLELGGPLPDEFGYHDSWWTNLIIGIE
ncbi:hypothetical protein DMA11_16475 [Marinilabiliaceae bacterium JC017]|nr:hypothetical protein DMA11_16475 [Marinilabiliaceae bacterium JC017]